MFTSYFAGVHRDDTQSRVVVFTSLWSGRVSKVIWTLCIWLASSTNTLQSIFLAHWLWKWCSEQRNQCLLVKERKWMDLNYYPNSNGWWFLQMVLQKNHFVLRGKTVGLRSQVIKYDLELNLSFACSDSFSHLVTKLFSIKGRKKKRNSSLFTYMYCVNVTHINETVEETKYIPF